MNKRYRNVTRAAAPRERAASKALADKIDRQERDSIVAAARRAKARCAMLRQAVRTLKSERQRMGLSLADVAARSGIDKAALSRLETALNVNPKIDTLLRYAAALGVELSLTVRRAA